LIVFAWFTGDARRAIALGQDIAQELTHDRVGTQHLLLGLLAQPGTVAALALNDLGLTVDGVRRAVVERFAMAAAADPGNLRFTSRMWRVVEVAAADPPIRRVGPAQLLLALLEEPESTACQILTEHVGELSTVGSSVAERLKGAKEAPSTELAFGGPLFLSSKRLEGQLLAAQGRFTGQARMVHKLSRHVARELMHDRLGTQHLLLGLLARPEELISSFPLKLTRMSTPVTSIYPTIAELALADVGVSLGEVRRAVVERCGIGAVKPQKSIGPTPRNQRVLELSLAAAESLHHDRIGPEHLLLALLEEPEST
jgi:ATP-dependent Clp protease ATP-binding subunit ClpA